MFMVVSKRSYRRALRRGKAQLGKSCRACRFCRVVGDGLRSKSLICFGFAIGRYGPRFSLKEPEPSVLLREFSVQSVASINSPDLLPAPAPDRKDKGNDSFSLVLDATAK